MLTSLLSGADGGVDSAQSLRKLKGDREMPRGLSCLARYYTGHPVSTDAGWAWELPGGELLPWDDGRQKTTEERFEDPDLEDILAVRYQAGPIVPITEGDPDAGLKDDPGRARVEKLFFATYGSTEKEVKSKLSKVRFFGERYTFHEKAAPALERVVENLKVQLEENPKLLPFLKDIGGTFKWRNIARSQTLSTHAFGIAIDLNVERGFYWRWTQPRYPIRWKNKVPQAIVDAFEAEGFIWGGRWLHYDTMHFEYRPELLDEDCAPERSVR